MTSPQGGAALSQVATREAMALRRGHSTTVSEATR
jgi:hypothetical protein